jgi:hypothetical protein
MLYEEQIETKKESTLETSITSPKPKNELQQYHNFNSIMETMNTIYCF